jgi:glucose/arabinose dehydrogenase
MRKSVGVMAAALLAGQVAQAQDPRNSPPLPSFPQIYETADLTIRVVRVADGLENPWSIAWLPNGDLLLTERAGRLRVLRNSVLDPEPIAGVPEVRITALGGLLDVLPHPNFATNRIIYLSSSKGGEGNLSTTAITRARLEGKKLEDAEEIFVAENWSTSPTNFGGRMVFGGDGMLYVAVGERQEQDRAQRAKNSR